MFVFDHPIVNKYFRYQSSTRVPNFITLQHTRRSTGIVKRLIRTALVIDWRRGVMSPSTQRNVVQSALDDKYIATLSRSRPARSHSFTNHRPDASDRRPYTITTT